LRGEKLFSGSERSDRDGGSANGAVQEPNWISNEKNAERGGAQRHKIKS